MLGEVLWVAAYKEMTRSSLLLPFCGGRRDAKFVICGGDVGGGLSTWGQSSRAKQGERRGWGHGLYQGRPIWKGRTDSLWKALRGDGDGGLLRGALGEGAAR